MTWRATLALDLGGHCLDRTTLRHAEISHHSHVFVFHDMAVIEVETGMTGKNPSGSRIQQFFVNGEGIDANRHYTVAFITSQGVPGKYGSNRRELPISAIDALRRYFSNHPRVNADFRGAVVVV